MKFEMRMTIAGAMTGTSCDGLDVSCVRFEPDGKWRVLWSAEAAYPKELRKRVLAAQLPGATLSLREWGAMNRDVGIWIGRSVAKMIAGHPNQKPDAIASHGQTVAHFPAAKKMGYTIQLGETARIAAATGLTTITDFREGDMAAGGQGAPLAPGFHALMAGGRVGIAIHNLGGISNLTYFGSGEIIAFDTGPGNCWIDAAAEEATGGKWKFDRGGELARKGRADLRAVETVLRHKFFAKAPPKSTGRDDFPFSLLKAATKGTGADLVATATEATVESIVRAYEKRLPLQAIYFCGGGARNGYLLESIQKRMSGVKVDRVEALGYDSKTLEAQAFAYFGHRALLGLELGGSWTGVDGWASPARITPGRNWGEILRRLWRGG